MKMTKFVGHAARPPWLLRNQCPYDIACLAGRLPVTSNNEDKMIRSKTGRILTAPHVTKVPLTPLQQMTHHH